MHCCVLNSLSFFKNKEIGIQSLRIKNNFLILFFKKILSKLGNHIGYYSIFNDSYISMR